jgi:hypothetical protein
MTDEEETAHIAEIARISLIRVEITERIVNTQIAMLLRDLGIKGEATTIIGKVELVGGHLSWHTPTTDINFDAYR